MYMEWHHQRHSVMKKIDSECVCSKGLPKIWNPDNVQIKSILFLPPTTLFYYPLLWVIKGSGGVLKEKQKQVKHPPLIPHLGL